jgi:diguanylate cyclase
MKTILVIEDEAFVRETVITVLENRGFRGIAASDGMAGIAQARSKRPDLIICDVRLPKCDGYTVLQTLRNEPNTAVTPFIFLSARAEQTDIRAGMNSGADDYLTKPFHIEDLLQTVEACFQKKDRLLRNYRDQVSRIQITLEKMAHWDDLTNLPNAQWFHHYLENYLQQYGQQSHFPPEVMAVLLLKVNNHRSVMLTFRQDVGDRFLKEVSDRLRVAAIPGTLARLSEDEFGIGMPDAGSIEEMKEYTQMLLGILMVPYHIDEQEIRAQISVGIALAPEHSCHTKELIMQAGTAMRWSRQQEPMSSYQVYSPALAGAELERHQLATDLLRGLEQSEFRVLYQPQVDLITHQLYGVEALVRWHHPDRGWVAPGQFIGVAEDLGLISRLGEWVLSTACRQVARWQSWMPIQLSVNLSMRQLQQPDFVLRVAKILQATGLRPEQLLLELTETAIMEQVKPTIQKLHQLKQLGVKLAIDDFGTGYSSLSYLSQLPIDELKIDRSFVTQVNDDRSAALICNAIIAMARSLNLNVIAEGIENQAQTNFLRQHGCHAGQGFFYSPPLTAAQLELFHQCGTQPRLSQKTS